ncbi:patatin-like phospholipase family protein [Niveibacterium umoris]|uniref:NTE family protein n=1 Tax=Niveibacterium umoris TaxID=1193620 RepID=A0A840BV69_9RHOO|nr:patatin-like phospholipase family protein [Niveibacterium umoris]MBB4014706.1 NTE family protein [Niveibacterium umoris]
MEDRAALVLTGGGARAAYQVGVLWAIRELRGRRSDNPFPILCGTSAGAINAVALASYAEDFDRSVRRLAWIWRHFHARHVYRADSLAVAKSALLWGGTLLWGWLLRRGPRSLLDNRPLRELLSSKLDFDGIGRALDCGALYAVSVTCSGYATGESLTFYEAAHRVQPWRRAARVGVPTRLNVDHLMASSAIPFVFPAIKINREFFGDGSMRQLAPVSPAVHLGATRILVVGAGRAKDETRRARGDKYPSPAQIAGHALSSIFLDGLAVDLERLERINSTVAKIPDHLRAELGINLKPIETLVISPSERLDHLAARHFKALPRPMRVMLRGVGSGGRSGSTVLSYLLFEASYTRALIDLGYRDAMMKRNDLIRFLRLDPASVKSEFRGHRSGFGAMTAEQDAEIQSEIGALSS